MSVGTAAVTLGGLTVIGAASFGTTASGTVVLSGMPVYSTVEYFPHVGATGDIILGHIIAFNGIGMFTPDVASAYTQTRSGFKIVPFMGLAPTLFDE